MMPLQVLAGCRGWLQCTHEGDGRGDGEGLGEGLGRTCRQAGGRSSSIG